MRILVWTNRNVCALLQRQISPINGVFGTHIPKAGLVSVSSPEYASRPPKMAPFPYKQKPFRFWRVYTSRTVNRLDENSKLIIIEGNVGIDKEAFGRKVAEEFGMEFFPAVTENDLFVTRNGFDSRSLNDRVGDKLKFWDYEKLYSVKDPKDAQYYLRTQLDLYKMKFTRYMDAVNHIWNTGQGVVMVRSVFSDLCFAKALRRNGVFSKKGYKHYERLYYQTQLRLISPHLFIYLDAPPSYCMEQIKKRGMPYEQNSTVLTERFLTDVDNTYRQDVLPQFKELSEVITYDVTKPLDYELVMEDLNDTNLDGPKVNEETKFYEWEPQLDIQMSQLRYKYGFSFRKSWYDKFDQVIPSLDIPELNITGAEEEDFEYLCKHPGIMYPDYFDPATGRY